MSSIHGPPPPNGPQNADRAFGTEAEFVGLLSWRPLMPTCPTFVKPLTIFSCIALPAPWADHQTESDTLGGVKVKSGEPEVTPSGPRLGSCTGR